MQRFFTQETPTWGPHELRTTAESTLETLATAHRHALLNAHIYGRSLSAFNTNYVRSNANYDHLNKEDVLTALNKLRGTTPEHVLVMNMRSHPQGSTVLGLINQALARLDELIDWVKIYVPDAEKRLSDMTPVLKDHVTKIMNLCDNFIAEYAPSYHHDGEPGPKRARTI